MIRIILVAIILIGSLQAQITVGGSAIGNGGLAGGNYYQNLNCTITTAAGSNCAVTYTGMDCVRIVVGGSYTGSASSQSTADGTNWQPADLLQQLTGKWTESLGSNGAYYSGAYAGTQFRILGPVSSGSMTINMTTTPGPCNIYAFDIPGSEVVNGFIGGAVAATGTQTTFPDSIQGHNSVDVQVKWASITGSPSGCTIQPQSSPDAVTYANCGAAFSVTPGTNANFQVACPMMLAVQFVYACSGYPSGGTIAVGGTYKPGSNTVNVAGTPAVTFSGTQPVNLNQINGLTVDPCFEAKPFPANVTTITSAKTYLAIALSSGKIIYPCAVFGTISGTTPSVEIEYGTTVTNPCDTGAQVIWGPIVVASGTPFQFGSGISELAFTAASNNLCLVVGGTPTSGTVAFTYIQQ